MRLKFMPLRFCMVVAIFAYSCDQSPPPPLEAPEHFPEFEIIVNSDDAFDGYIFLRESTSPGGQFMIDNKGKIVWYQVSDTAILRVFTPYEESYLALYSNSEIHEVSYRGDTILKLSYGEGGFDKVLHHEIIKDNDNNIIALTKDTLYTDLSNRGGQEIDTVVTDGILKLSPSGQKLWSWRLDDVLDPDSDTTLNRFKHDWGHANALAIDSDENYLVSWRDFNQVWKINSKTGELIWKYGAETITNIDDKFYQQHAIHRNMAGDYMVFDNGHARSRKHSRALSFQQAGDSLRNIFSINLPDSLFTFKQGSVYQFDKDRFLFSSTMSQTIVITNSQGEILWLAKSAHGFYRAYYLDKGILRN